MNYYLKVLKQYTDFNGRARRKEYWMFFLFNIIISIILRIIDSQLFGHQAIGPVYSLAVFLPGIAVGVRRMHDVGKSGWFILIPFYNLILACTDGERRTNEYGPDPKGSGSGEFVEQY